MLEEDNDCVEVPFGRGGAERSLPAGVDVGAARDQDLADTSVSAKGGVEQSRAVHGPCPRVAREQQLDDGHVALPRGRAERLVLNRFHVAAV